MIQKKLFAVSLKLLPYIIALVIALLSFLTYDRNAKKAIEETKTDFPRLTSGQFLTEKVIEIYCPREVRCATPPVFVIFDGGRKKSINADESIDRTTTLIELISAGDSLFKKSNNDTLFVYKNDKVTSFLIH